MLNEIFLLHNALQEAGIVPEKMHPDIKVPGATTGPAARLRLNPDGSIFAMEPMTDTELPGLWTHLKTSEGSFPVLRLKEPLLLVPANHEFSWKQKDERGKTKRISPSKRRQEMQHVATICEINVPFEDTVDMLLRLLSEKAQLLAAVAKQANLRDIEAVCRAYQATLTINGEPDSIRAIQLLTSLKEHAVLLLDSCEEGELDLLELLLFEPPNERRKYNRKSTQLALDIADVDSQMYRSVTRKALSSAMLEFTSSSLPRSTRSQKPQAGTSCAFSDGKATVLQSEAFPPVKLPYVATKGLPLFSMNSAAPCNERYGHKDNDLMPVSKDLVLQMQDALSEVVRQDRRGKTWRAIASENSDQPDLLIVYVDGGPQISSNVADFFGTDDDQLERQFDVDTQTLCDALDAIVKAKPDSRLHLFVVRKASEGQAFVALAETPTVDEVLRGARWWQQAGKNVPEFSLRIRVRDQTEQWYPRTPSPGQVVHLLAQIWTPSSNNKLQANKVRGTAFSEVLNLMLQRQYRGEGAAERILHTLLRHEKSLLVGIGNCLHKGNDRKDWEKYPDHVRKVVLRAVSLLGITLYASGSTKEEYMKQEAYLIGQVLSLADRLHRCYCTIVRDGKYPPNLIGNAVFDAALDNPNEALGTLAVRIRIYIGWAQTVPLQYNGEDAENKQIAAREAKSILERYKPIAARLGEMELPRVCDDQMRAQMLLGYLASVGKTSGGGDGSEGGGDK